MSVPENINLMVCGSRSITDKEWVFSQMEAFWYWNAACYDDVTLIEGGATGVDSLAKEYAQENDWFIKEFPANWKKYGKSAGYRRNKDMVHNCDLCLILWDGKSKGTQHDIELCEKEGKKYFLLRYDLNENYSKFIDNRENIDGRNTN